jgi:hypothetical protein
MITAMALAMITASVKADDEFIMHRPKVPCVGANTYHLQTRGTDVSSLMYFVSIEVLVSVGANYGRVYVKPEAFTLTDGYYRNFVVTPEMAGIHFILTVKDANGKVVSKTEATSR